MAKKEIKNNIKKLEEEFNLLDPDNHPGVRKAYALYRKVQRKVYLMNRERRDEISSHSRNVR